MRAYPLETDEMGRWQAYEIGTLVECTFEKYDYLIAFSDVYIPKNMRTKGSLFENITIMKREYYFY